MRELYKKFTKSVVQFVSPETSRVEEPQNADWYTDTVVQTRAKLLVALGRMLPLEEAEEVIQEVYLKLYLVAKTDKPDNPIAYVHRLARNLAISKLRSQTVADTYAREISVQAQDGQYSEGPAASCTKEQDKLLLLDAINGLPPICRQVFVLRKLHGKSHKEISHELAISIKTVENHISKGMQHCHWYLTRTHCKATIKSLKKLA